MALNFKNLRDPKLGLTDKLQFGKFKDCRLCDIVEDHYDYLIWAEKQGYVKFQQDVTNLILEQAHFEKWTESIKQDLYEVVTTRVNYYSDIEDDIPF